MSTLDLAARQQQEAAARIRESGIHLKEEEVAGIEIADFGLNRFDVGPRHSRLCEHRSLLRQGISHGSGQICPEHRHPPVDGQPGKEEETFRCREGECISSCLGIKDSGEKEFALAMVPEDKRDTFTMFKHYHLKAGDQCTSSQIPRTGLWPVRMGRW